MLDFVIPWVSRTMFLIETLRVFTEGYKFKYELFISRILHYYERIVTAWIEG